MILFSLCQIYHLKKKVKTSYSIDTEVPLNKQVPIFSVIQELGPLFHDFF